MFNIAVTFPVLRRAKAIHVTSDEEFRNVEALSMKNIRLIKNGVDREVFENFTSQGSRYFDPSKFIFLFMSRTDKEKGLDILFNAYRAFSEKHSSAEHVLAIVGPDHGGYLETLSDDIKGLNIYRNTGVYGEEKLQIISESHVVVLPSYSENFGNIVVEGMAMGKPVITTQGTPWKVLQDFGLGYWIKAEVDLLADAMDKVYLCSQDARVKMGISAREYAFDNLSWDTIAQELVALYKDVYDSSVRKD